MQMNRERNWTVLFVGGASGVGKSSLAYELGRYYGVNVMEADDVYQAVKVMTSRDAFPAIHYWSADIDWMDVGVQENVDWLINVSREMIPALKTIAENHLEGDVPIIIEGDFIYPELTVALNDPRVKALYVHENDADQIVQNYLAREGGQAQYYRAQISSAYGNWLVNTCSRAGIHVIAPKPWNTLLHRAIEKIL